MKKYEFLDLPVKLDRSQSTKDFNVYENEYVKVIESFKDKPYISSELEYTIEMKTGEWEPIQFHPGPLYNMNVTLRKIAKKVSKKRKNKEAENE